MGMRWAAGVAITVVVAAGSGCSGSTGDLPITSVRRTAADTLIVNSVCAVGLPLYSAAVTTWGNAGRVAFVGGMVAVSWLGVAYRRFRGGSPDPDPAAEARVQSRP